MMSRLMQELLADPNATFELEADLPTGNRMTGTVGPLMGDKLCASLRFTRNPASDKDIAYARAVMAQAIGGSEEMAIVSNTPDEHRESIRAVRRFLGGGNG